ncbi:MAG TPA: metal ABC transporter substrate-binding protein [Anaeromyxobacteraceae bacterium]|nr:metal ABC transporter substrate-binding protein [Anaeromyxobacteraceae bacterium]
MIPNHTARGGILGGGRAPAPRSLVLPGPRALVALAALAAALPARAALNVVATTEGLASLAREVGGARVSVESLCRGVQDPHFVDPNPTLAVKLRRADLLVDVGLDLEVGWLPPLVTQSRNAEIQPGGRRRLSAASAVAVLETPSGPVDRTQGDLHPAGNPHFLADPRRARQVAGAIAGRLAQLDPAGAASYQANLAAFSRRLAEAEARWAAELAPLKGRKVVTHHRTLTYFLDWSGLDLAGVLEPKPGVPPPPSHLADLVGVVKREGVKAVAVENYYDPKSGELVARLGGARLVGIPGDVGGVPAATGYLEYLDALVRLLSQAVR